MCDIINNTELVELLIFKQNGNSVLIVFHCLKNRNFVIRYYDKTTDQMIFLYSMEMKSPWASMVTGYIYISFYI